MMIMYCWLVVSNTLKTIGQLGLLFPIYLWKDKECSKPPTRLELDALFSVKTSIWRSLGMYRNWMPLKWAASVFHWKITENAIH